MEAKIFLVLLMISHLSIAQFHIYEQQTKVDTDEDDENVTKNETELTLRSLPLEVSSSQNVTTSEMMMSELKVSESPKMSRKQKSKNLNEKIDNNDNEDTTILYDLSGSTDMSYLEASEYETTIHPTTKKAKQLEIYKTRPNELLRHYVDDTNLRPPIAALVDKKLNPLTKSRQLWKTAVRPKATLDIMLVSYDSEGIRSIYNISNSKIMMSTLNRIREENATSDESQTYYSIIRTGQIIPYDSAIFLSTDVLPKDTQHQQSASMILLKKRIRLYLIIFDDKNFKMQENSTTAVRKTGFLGQLALRTGGDIIYVPNNAFRSDGEMALITLVVGNRLKSPLDTTEYKEIDENVLNSYDRSLNV